MTVWRESVLGDLCTRVTVGHVGKMATEYVPDGVPFLRSQNVRPFVIDKRGLLYIGDDFNAKLRKSALTAGDVVIVRTGYPGTAAVVPEDLDGSNCADLVVITPSDALNPHVLAALFNSVYGQHAVSSQLVGSAQQHFNVGSAKTMRVRLPDRAEQDHIAAVLCSINDLIENNRRRVEVLEGMARTIYREWFVKFRYPGNEGVPLVDSALGPAPKGWEVANLFDAADVGFGYSFKSPRFSNSGPFQVIRIRDIPVGISRTYTDEAADPRYAVYDDDVLIGMDGDFHMTVWTGEDAWLNQRVTRLRPRLGLSALHLLLAIEEQIKDWNRAIVGTTVAHLGKKHLQLVNVLVPNDAVRIDASVVFAPIMEERRALIQSSRRLAALRDLLLPKLVSGQIDVSALDLDAVVGEQVA
ncbi:restriction endonuclease subunit S [Mycolicibacterium monacense]|uniref:Type I restriction-modification system specificity subunit n=3 Tax=Mycobacteriaceae TaxID=1762 RepID=A0A5Q5BDB1_MYCSS|nr:restriction endonuclease subunit S [Mycolicibacterium monacense]